MKPIHSPYNLTIKHEHSVLYGTEKIGKIVLNYKENDDIRTVNTITLIVNHKYTGKYIFSRFACHTI
jgi:hypothetical protein